MNILYSLLLMILMTFLLLIYYLVLVSGCFLHICSVGRSRRGGRSALVAHTQARARRQWVPEERIDREIALLSPTVVHVDDIHVSSRLGCICYILLYL